MGERTEYTHGTHSWVDLATTDVDAARKFYAELFGWEFEDLPAGEDMTYTMASLDGTTVAALFKGDGSLPVHWNSYVTVDDVDATAEKVEQLGGKLTADPMDVMEAGRMLVLQDPAGAFLNLWQAKDNIGAGLVNVPGALTWNDLNTTDPEAAMRFYGELLGWEFKKVEGAPDLDYWMIHNGDRVNGGLRPIDNSQAGDVPSHWLPFFAAGDARQAQEKVEDLGGRTFLGPMDLPNGGTMAVVADAQGGVFGLFSGDFDD